MTRTISACFTLAILSSGPAAAQDVTLDSLVGEWLNTEFIKWLETSRSPATVPFDENIRWRALHFSHRDSHIRWEQILGYHEALTRKVSGLQHEELDAYKVLFHDRLTDRFTNEDRLLITPGAPVQEMTWLFHEGYRHDKEERRIAFKRVEPSTEVFVNRTVIAGTYTDRKGRSFSFDETGRAAWPDSMFFRYVVELDGHGTAYMYDVFYALRDSTDRRSRLAYSFEWRDDRLFIFSTREHDMTEPFTPSVDPYLIRDENPLFVLTPQTRLGKPDDQAGTP